MSAVVDSGQVGPDNEGRPVGTRTRSRILGRHRIVRALGRGRVKAAVVGPTNGGGSGGTERIRCDLICMASGPEPADGLLHQAGDLSLSESTGRRAGVMTAGDVNGTGDLDAAVVQGRKAEAPRLPELGTAPTRNRMTTSDRPCPQPRSLTPRRRPAPEVLFVFAKTFRPTTSSGPSKKGSRTSQTLKRYTTVSMGPCQGKMCGKRLTEICAQRTGRSITDMAGPPAGPPFRPVSLAVLAGTVPHAGKALTLRRRAPGVGSRHGRFRAVAKAP